MYEELAKAILARRRGERFETPDTTRKTRVEQMEEMAQKILKRTNKQPVSVSKSKKGKKK